MLPARAGMIPELYYPIKTMSRAPRTSGDDPFPANLLTFCQSCSPHERG